MRDDLVYAQAAVDWAMAQLPSLNERIEAWLALNVEMVVRDQPPPAPYDMLVAVEKAPLPLAFSIEVGSYVNVIRSSLDMLATALAARYGVTRPEDAYFPVSNSAAAFASGGDKGSKFVKGLPDAERTIIERLKPYQGGNETLWALHRLDIMRKHRRLLDIEIRPLQIGVTGLKPPGDDYQPIATGYIRVNNETALGLIRKGATGYNVKVFPHVAFNEAEPRTREPIVRALSRFAGYAGGIIRRFG
jgi:hypothetical protein